jgi:AraC-like DNA-binding protein
VRAWQTESVLASISPVRSLSVSSFSGVLEAVQTGTALPHASVTMLIELGGGSTVVGGVHSRFALAGLQSGPTSFQQRGSIDCVEIRMAPSVALRLGLGVHCLKSAVVPAESYFGQAAGALIDRLAETNYNQRAGVVRDTFRSLLLSSRKTRSVELIERLERAGMGVDVGHVAADFGGSRSAFWRNTRSALGISPQHYLMLRRFERAATLLEARIPIAQVAAIAGYADQSHLHREVLRFAGVTPGRLVSSHDATYVQDLGLVAHEY